MKKEPIKAVVFDMDGLILDTEPFYKRALQKGAAHFGYTLSDDFFPKLIGQSTPSCERILLKKFGEGFPLEDFRKYWPQLWREEATAKGIPIKPGFHEILDFLEELQLPRAIATSSGRKTVNFSLSKAGLDKAFEIIVSGDQIANGKPAPDIYLEAAMRLNIDPERCVALEDSRAGILSASSAGMKAIMVPDLVPPTEEVRAAAYEIADTLFEAKEIIKSLL